MGIFANNNNKPNGKQNTIWVRYMKLIVPSVIALIILMDIIIYAVVASKSKENISESSYKTVELLSKNIEQIFKRYEADLHIMGKEYRDNPTEFMEYAQDFIRGHVNEYSYVRLTLLNGESYTTIAGKDPNDAKYRKLYKQIVVEGKDISVNNAHPTDVCEGDVFSISIPIKGKNGVTKAVVTAVFPADVIDRHLIPSEEGKSEFIAVVDDIFILRLYHGAPISANIEKLVEKGFSGLDKTIYNGAKEMEYGQKRGSGTYKTPDGWTMVCHYTQIGDMKWFITLNVPLMVLNMDILVTSIVLLITGILTILIVLLVIKNITHKVIMTPLQAINRFSNDLAEGKLYSTETRNITSKDELATVRDNIEKMQHKLQTVVTDIRKSTDEVYQNTTLIRDTVLKISEDALVQSACVDDISSSIDSMNTYIMQNAERASATKNNSEEIEQDIDIITMASDNTLESIQNVIGKIKVINEISTRTDLLAINAAVEAARAGENGKGFAVVAAEIRKLAEHCQKASKEINELSEESLYITQQSAEFIQNTIPKIKENAESISEISDNCNNQLNMTENISRAILQLVDITSHNSQSSDDMQVSTQVLYKNMKELNESMDFFKLTTEKNKHRESIISEIQGHTSEILKLKAKLVTVAESKQDSQEVDQEIDRAIALADEVTKKDDCQTESNEEVEKTDDKSDEFFNSVDEFMASDDHDKVTPVSKPTFNSKPDKDLDRGFESF